MNATAQISHTIREDMGQALCKRGKHEQDKYGAKKFARRRAEVYATGE